MELFRTLCFGSFLVCLLGWYVRRKESVGLQASVNQCVYRQCAVWFGSMVFGSCLAISLEGLWPPSPTLCSYDHGSRNPVIQTVNTLADTTQAQRTQSVNTMRDTTHSNIAGHYCILVATPWMQNVPHTFFCWSQTIHFSYSDPTQQFARIEKCPTLLRNHNHHTNQGATLFNNYTVVQFWRSGRKVQRWWLYGALAVRGVKCIFNSILFPGSLKTSPHWKTSRQYQENFNPRLMSKRNSAYQSIA